MPSLLKNLLPFAVFVVIFAGLFGARYTRAAWIVDALAPDTTSITVTCGGTSIASGGECNATTANITITCSDAPAVNFSGCYRIHYSLAGTFPYTTCQVIDETGRTFGLCNPVQTSLTQTYTHSLTMGTTQSDVIIRACSSDGAGNKEWTDANSNNIPDAGDTIDPSNGICKEFLFEFTAVGGWWQVVDGDIMASGGGIQSLIPQGCSGSCKPYLNLEAGGVAAGYPGVTAYGSSTANFGPGGQVARDTNERWLANSGYAGRKYDYEYFKKFVPPAAFTDSSKIAAGSTISGGTLISGYQSGDGYEWRYAEGDLTYHGTANVDDRKLILIVNGNFNIGDSNNNAQITVTKGSGFFAAIVKGNINISGKVERSGSQPSLEGLYMADGVISTGSQYPTDDEQLRIRGALIGWGGITFQRDLGDNENEDNPGEKIEYAPDLLFSFPRQLLREGLVWREIAP